MESFLPLFPLDIVLFPEMLLPLHIFEERYKEMVGECIQNKSHFGILYAHDESIEEIGCTAEITRIIKNYPDGRMDILTMGRQRFQVLFLDKDKPYLRGSVEPYGDAELSNLPTDEDASRVLELYKEVYRLLNRSDAEEIATGSPAGLSFKIASILNLNNQLKQQILVLQSERARISALHDYFSEIIPQLTQAQQAIRRAGSNGNLNRG